MQMQRTIFEHHFPAFSLYLAPDLGLSPASPRWQTGWRSSGQQW